MADYSRSHRVQNFVVIYLNCDNDNKRRQHSITQLEQIIPQIDVFDNIDQSIDFLTDMQDEKFCMIIEGSIDNCLLSLIDNIPQLNFVYILRDEGVFNKTEHISNLLGEKRREFDPSFMYSELIKEIFT
jgi:hypothetical protein